MYKSFIISYASFPCIKQVGPPSSVIHHTAWTPTPPLSVLNPPRLSPSVLYQIAPDGLGKSLENNLFPNKCPGISSLKTLQSPLVLSDAKTRFFLLLSNTLIVQLRVRGLIIKCGQDSVLERTVRKLKYKFSEECFILSGFLQQEGKLFKKFE